MGLQNEVLDLNGHGFNGDANNNIIQYVYNIYLYIDILWYIYNIPQNAKRHVGYSPKMMLLKFAFFPPTALA